MFAVRFGRTPCVAALALSLFVVTAAQAQAPTPIGPGPSAPAPAPTTVLATVAGSEIRQSDVDIFVSELPPQAQSIPRDQLTPLVLQELINIRIVSQAARKEKLDQDEGFKRRVVMMNERLLNETFLAKRMAEQLTEARIKKRYEEMIKEESGDEQVRASHIQVESKDEALKIAEEIKKGADFADTARKRSKGPSAPGGGDLGFFSFGEMMPTFSEVAFKMQKGQVSEPVQTQFGWHVIKVTDRRKVPPPSLEELRPEIQQQLSGQIMGEVLAKASEGVQVVVMGLDGKPLPSVAPKK